MATPLNQFGFPRGSAAGGRSLLDNYGLNGKAVTYRGSGLGPLLDPGQQRYVQRYGAQINNSPIPGAEAGGMEEGGFDLGAIMEAGAGGGGGGVIPFEPGPIQSMIDNLLKDILAGEKKGPVQSVTNKLLMDAIKANQNMPPELPWMRNFLRTSISGTGKQNSPAIALFNLARGTAPPAIREAFRQQQKLDRAANIESFGSAGARFGSDLATSLGREGGLANVRFAAAMADKAQAALNAIGGLGTNLSNLDIQMRQAELNRALQAINQIFGLGTTMAGLEFAGGQNALERALQEFLAAQQNPLGLPPI